MLEWLAGNPWAVWLALAAVLAISEMTTLDMTLLMLSTGALAGFLVALVLPGMIGVQIAVAIVVALLSLLLVRPSILRRLHRGVGFRSSVEKIVGSRGLTLSEVTASAGEIRVDGETWSARSYDGEPIPSGVEVDVFEIDGVIVRVHPSHRPLT